MKTLMKALVEEKHREYFIPTAGVKKFCINFRR